MTEGGILDLLTTSVTNKGLGAYVYTLCKPKQLQGEYLLLNQQEIRTGKMFYILANMEEIILLKVPFTGDLPYLPLACLF